MKVSTVFMVLVVLLINLLAMLDETSTLSFGQGYYVLLILAILTMGVFSAIAENHKLDLLFILYFSVSLLFFLALYLLNASLGFSMIVGFSLNSFGLVVVVDDLIKRERINKKNGFDSKELVKEAKELEETAKVLQKAQKIINKDTKKLNESKENLSKKSPEKPKVNIERPKSKLKSKKTSSERVEDINKNEKGISLNKVSDETSMSKLHTKKSESSVTNALNNLSDLSSKNYVRSYKKNNSGWIEIPKQAGKLKRAPEPKNLIKKKYVAGKNSKMYHVESCPVAKRIKKKRYYETKEKAELAGYIPHDCVK